MKLEFKISSTALNINRDLKTSLYLLISGIIGLLAGVLQSVGTAMNQFEKYKKKYQSRKSNKTNFKEMTEKRANFEDFLYLKPAIKRTKTLSTFLKPVCNIRTNFNSGFETTAR